MGPAAKYLLGMVPAVILLTLALFGAPFLGPTLAVSALLGMCGLIWSFIGYSRKTAALVLLLLLIGVFTVLGGTYVGPLSVFLSDARSGELGALPSVMLRVMLLSWLFLGPAVLGVMQVWRVAGVLWGRQHRGDREGPLVS